MSAHHYCYGSGMPGCLYDYGPNFCETLEQATEGLLLMFGDQLEEGESERLRENLAAYGIHYFENPLEAGAVYCDATIHPGECPEDEES